MTTNRPNPKCGGMNVIIGEVCVEGDSLTLHYGLGITPPYHHNGQIRSSKMIPETLKNLEKYTHDMGNEKSIGTLDHHNFSSPLSVG